MSKLDPVIEGLRKRIEALGYEYVGAELVTENSFKILRVYADKDNGLDIGDCEKISRESNDFLDQYEAEMPARYFLEVSSPGLERPLFSIGDYRSYIGEKAALRLRGKKMLAGVIKDVSDEGVVVISCEGGEERSLPFSEIRRGNLIFTPEAGEKNTFKKIPKKKNNKK